MPRPSVIAIDGPAGSGKSTVSFYLAERFNYLFIDTGVFYRVMTLVALRSHISLDDTTRLGQLVHDTEIEIHPAPDDPDRHYTVWVNGENVTDDLRSDEVNAHVSTVSAIASVRHELLPKQRAIATQGHVIMAGRDIGTVVLPDADIKFYVDASLEERARRRYRQKEEKGETADMQQIQESLRKRDEIDTQREVSPLRQADDALYILTDGKSIEAVVDEIAAAIDNWGI